MQPSIVHPGVSLTYNGGGSVSSLLRCCSSASIRGKEVDLRRWTEGRKELWKERSQVHCHLAWSYIQSFQCR